MPTRRGGLHHCSYRSAAVNDFRPEIVPVRYLSRTGGKVAHGSKIVETALTPQAATAHHTPAGVLTRGHTHETDHRDTATGSSRRVDVRPGRAGEEIAPAQCQPAARVEGCGGEVRLRHRLRP